MSDEYVTCLFCQTKNKTTEAQCSHCGMPLSKNSPNSTSHRRQWFKKWFWPLVLFCIVMMFYLPR